MEKCQFCGADPFKQDHEDFGLWKCNTFITDLRDQADGPIVQSVSCRIRELAMAKQKIHDLEQEVTQLRETINQRT